MQNYGPDNWSSEDFGPNFGCGAHTAIYRRVHWTLLAKEKCQSSVYNAGLCARREEDNIKMYLEKQIMI